MIISNNVDYSFSNKQNRKRMRDLMSPCTVIKPNGEIKVIPVCGMTVNGSIKKAYRG